MKVMIRHWKFHVYLETYLQTEWFNNSLHWHRTRVPGNEKISFLNYNQFETILRYDTDRWTIYQASFAFAVVRILLEVLLLKSILGWPDTIQPLWGASNAPLVTSLLADVMTGLHRILFYIKWCKKKRERGKRKDNMWPHFFFCSVA